MNEIDWSKAPEGYPVWVEDLMHGEKSHGWHKQSEGRWVDQLGRYWEKSAVERGNCRAHYRPEPTPSWSGEGLPPVGVVCEAAIPHASGPNNERSFIWIEGSVIAYYEIKGKTYAWFAEADGFYPPSILEFRPIRTPEQIAADERDKAAHDLFRTAWPETHSWGDLSPHWQEAFYRLADAGYRKP